MRMNMRRFARLTNGFSKKLANLMAEVALHYMYCNFARIHQTPRVSPARAAVLVERHWEVEDLVRLQDGSN